MKEVSLDKLLEELPKEIVEMYRIRVDGDSLEIHQPSYICITKLDKVKLESDPVSIHLFSDVALITLWKGVPLTHTVIFRK